MARFKADIEGQKGIASRLGSAKSGIRAHVRGWNIGARVECSVDADGKDVVTIHLTSGSNDAASSRFLGAFTEADIHEEGRQ